MNTCGCSKHILENNKTHNNDKLSHLCTKNHLPRSLTHTHKHTVGNCRKLLQLQEVSFKSHVSRSSVSSWLLQSQKHLQKQSLSSQGYTKATPEEKSHSVSKEGGVITYQSGAFNYLMKSSRLHGALKQPHNHPGGQELSPLCGKHCSEYSSDVWAGQNR